MLSKTFLVKVRLFWNGDIYNEQLYPGLKCLNENCQLNNGENALLESGIFLYHESYLCIDK